MAETKPLESREMDEELGRWQDAIYQLCRKSVGPKSEDEIDGGGCDSGDPLDLSLTEIRQAIGLVKEQVERETLERAAQIAENLDHRGCVMLAECHSAIAEAMRDLGKG